MNAASFRPVFLLRYRAGAAPARFGRSTRGVGLCAPFTSYNARALRSLPLTSALWRRDGSKNNRRLGLPDLHPSAGIHQLEDIPPIPGYHGRRLGPGLLETDVQ